MLRFYTILLVLALTSVKCSKDVEEPDQFKDMTNEDLDRFIRLKGSASA